MHTKGYWTWLGNGPVIINGLKAVSGLILN